MTTICSQLKIQWADGKFDDEEGARHLLEIDVSPASLRLLWLFIFKLTIMEAKLISNDKRMKKASKKFTVWVDDNFHYMDESERYKQGEYDTP